MRKLLFAMPTICFVIASCGNQPEKKEGKHTFKDMPLAEMLGGKN